MQVVGDGCVHSDVNFAALSSNRFDCCSKCYTSLPPATVSHRANTYTEQTRVSIFAYFSGIHRLKGRDITIPVRSKDEANYRFKRMRLCVGCAPRRKV